MAKNEGISALINVIDQVGPDLRAGRFYSEVLSSARAIPTVRSEIGPYRRLPQGYFSRISGNRDPDQYFGIGFAIARGEDFAIHPSQLTACAKQSQTK